MSSTTRSYHAVSVHPRGTCCDAASAVDGQRFFPGDAPQLPLPGCDRCDTCRCRYRHWDDRRQLDDRRSPYVGIANTLHLATNRRSGRERRKG